MLSVVVFLVLVQIVVHSIFLLTLLLVILAGTMVLLYHLKRYTHYTDRGCSSGGGSNCGAFCVLGNGNASYTYWDFGAAL